jgi:Sugar phosphate permease
MLAYIHSFFTRQLISVTAVDLREAFQLSNLQIGLLYGTFFSIFYAVAGIPMGRLADRTSRKAMILTGLAIWSTATLLTGFATTFTLLILLRILLGLSQSMLSPAVYSYLADYAPEKDRASAFSIYAAGIFIGVGLSFLIGGEITQSTSWQQAFQGSGLMGLLLVPILLLLLREPQGRTKHYPGSASTATDEIRRILRIPSVRWHLTGFAALACTGYTVLAFAGILLTDPSLQA